MAKLHSPLPLLPLHREHPQSVSHMLPNAQRVNLTFNVLNAPTEVQCLALPNQSVRAEEDFRMSSELS